LYATLFDETGANVLVDSSKSPKRAYLLKQYLKKNYNVKIIHLVRDGRAVLYSYLKGYYKVRIKNPETGDLENKTFFSNHKRTEAESINIWKKDNKQALLYHNSVFFGKNGYYFMRYEDFANYPEKELNKLLNFIGVEYETEMLNLKRYENHMVSGNASRINAQSIEKPFEGWKEQLTEKQLDYFNRKAKKLNQKFGYQK
ncbi:MAG: sulfotransferase domain-containing protein, partial [bacterium]